MRTLLAALCLLSIAPLAHAANECDISLRPAATLLLPYFEVSLQPGGTTTLFTITNTTKMPQIAHVTMWTDLGFPALRFNIFLTGYDVVPINIYDILVNGFIGNPGVGTSSRTIPGDISLPNDANPHFLPSAANNCAALPGRIPPDYIPLMQAIFTTGRSDYPLPHCNSVGLPHANAAGYITIDVAATCGTSDVTEARYWDELLNDNVLTGDYEIVDSKSGLATGSPLVHIRAMEGLPKTFYERYAPKPGLDKRQPLPNVVALRTLFDAGFRTRLLIWAQPLNRVSVCDYSNNRAFDFRQIVTFDEHENNWRSDTANYVEGGGPPTVPVSSSPDIDNFVSRPNTGDAGGWTYLDFGAEQAWVVSRLISGSMTVQLDGTAIGNACSAAPALP